MTFTAWTAPLPVRAEIRMFCEHLPTLDQIVVGIVTLTIIVSIFVLFWDTGFLPDGSSFRYFPFGSAYDYVDGLEYCLSPTTHTTTGPVRLHLDTCSWR